MADVDQSLDQIIRSKKTYRGRGGRGGRGRGGYRGGRGRGRGYGGQMRRSNSFTGGTYRSTSYNRPPRSTPAKWQHDMYANGFGGGFQGRGGGGPSSGSKLLVSNLDYGVSDDDIRELFQEFGRVRKVAVHYDKSGRSLGTANVFFERRVDAFKAVKQYNGVPLDGRPMSIQMIDGAEGTKTSTATPNKVNIRQRVGSAPTTPVSSSGGYGGRGRGRGRGRGGRGRGRGRGGGTREPVPSKDELDAELDAYRQTTNAES